MDQLDLPNTVEVPAGDAAASPAVLAAVGLTKTFSGISVVDGADVTFRAGEVHGIVGQNGAGKSSLMKMMAGVYKADAGHVDVSGTSHVFSTPRQARDQGVSMVAQELSLVPALSVAENILLGQQPSRASVVDRAALRDRASALIKDRGFELDPDAIVASLSASDQQKVEILRALASNTRLIVFDEPTSSMSIDDSRNLYDIIRDLAESGTSVALVSHFLEEILDVCDVVTVMRDGHVVVASEPAESLSSDKLIQYMVGDVNVDGGAERVKIDRTGTPRISVNGLTGQGYHDVSLRVFPCEIVALVGLVGAGRSEILRGIFGVDPPGSGTIEIDGVQADFRRPADAVKAGLGMVTESRKHDGIFPVLATTTNVAIGQPGATSSGGFIRKAFMRRRATSVAMDVSVHGNIDGPIASLSGGNQQKALLGRWLMEPPRLYLIDEPTRGVDVVSIQQIHALLRRLAAGGMSVLMVTSEFEEALAVADRIYTVRNGTIVLESDAADSDKESLLAAAFGTDKKAAS